MKNLRLLITSLAASCILAGCAALPIPLSAQRGSSMLVPLSSDVLLGFITPVGYGGHANDPADVEVADPQRGALRYYLDDSSVADNILTNRGSSRVAAAPASLGGRTPGFNLQQVVSLIDIPVNAPLGRHTLYAQAMLDGLPNGPALLVGDIDILPETVNFTDAGQSYSISGRSTPVPLLSGASLQDAVPDPLLIVPFGAAVHSITLTVGLHPCCEALGAVDPVAGTGPGSVLLFYEQLSPQSAAIRAVSTTPAGFDQVALAFRPLAGQRLDPTQVGGFVFAVGDENGDPVDLGLQSGVILDSSTFSIR